MTINDILYPRKTTLKQNQYQRPNNNYLQKVTPKEELDLSSIQNENDRIFIGELINTLFKFEPDNESIFIKKNLENATWFISAEGFKKPIEEYHFRMIHNLSHPIISFIAIKSLKILQVNTNPMKFVVEVHPYCFSRQEIDTEFQQPLYIQSNIPNRTPLPPPPPPPPYEPDQQITKLRNFEENDTSRYKKNLHMQRNNHKSRRSRSKSKSRRRQRSQSPIQKKRKNRRSPSIESSTSDEGKNNSGFLSKLFS